MTTNNTSPCRSVNFGQLSLTLEIAYRAGGPGDDTPEALAWVIEQLNSKPEFAAVKAVNATGLLCWPDFLDAASYGPEHPDYQADAALLEKVEHWLTLDRKALIQALLRSEGEKAALRSEMSEWLTPSNQNAEGGTPAG